MRGPRPGKPARYTDVGLSGRHAPSTEFGMFAYAPLSGTVYGVPRRRAWAPGGRPYGLVAAAALAGVTLVDPDGLDPRRRRALAALEAGVSGALIAPETTHALRAAARESGSLLTRPGRIVTVLAGFAAGAATTALTLRTTALTDRVDRTVVAALGRAGIPRPRALLAGATALGMLAQNEATRRELRRPWVGPAGALGGPWEDSPWENAPEPEPERLVPAPPEVAALVATLLEPPTPLPEAARALRAQLPHLHIAEPVARALEDGWVPEEIRLAVVREDPGPNADPSVAAGPPRAVPHDLVWPVQARAAAEPHDVLLRLRIAGGDLAALELLPCGDHDVDHDVDHDLEDPEEPVCPACAVPHLAALPAPDALRLQVDGTRRD